MTVPVGFLVSGVQLGLQSILIKPRRSIGPFTAQVVIEESHTDEIEITDHPVEHGAQISDHAFKRPAEVVIRCGWSNSPSQPGLLGGIVAAARGTVAGVAALFSGSSASHVVEVYEKLLELQSKLITFDVQTGKRLYTDMLLRSLSTMSDSQNEQTLMVTAVLRQVIVVRTTTIARSAPSSRQSDPGATQSSVDVGTRQLLPTKDYTPELGVSP